MKIIKHKSITKQIKLPYIFKCSACGCEFETDEYGIGAERCMNGRRWFAIDCPECIAKVRIDVSPETELEYVKTVEETMDNATRRH